MPEEKYVPHRKCIACRTVRPKNELIRIVLINGRLAADPENRLPGRGCYVCRDAKCVSQAAEKNFFSRSFKKSFSKEELACISEELNKFNI